jgi:hypothetical protein
MTRLAAGAINVSGAWVKAFVGLPPLVLESFALYQEIS